MKVVLVLPIYNEITNIDTLISRLQEVSKKLKNHDMSILVVDDDSPVETAIEIKKLQKKYENIFLLGSKKEGCGAACIRGFVHAGNVMRPDALIMMNSGLSHPPELIPEVMKEIEDGFDLVIGSRYVRGGGTPDLNFGQKMFGRIRNISTRLITGLYSVHDCTSGYLAIKYSSYRQIDPTFVYRRDDAFLTTLLYEMITHGAQVKEVPLVMYDRKSGETKLRAKDIIEFIQNAVRIRFKSTERMIKFAAVGGSGIFVNLAIFSSVKYLFSVSHALSDTTLLVSSLCGDEISILFNFILNHVWTFKNTTNDDHIIIKLLKFHAVSIVSIMINNSVLFTLYKMLGVPDILAKFIGILVAFIWNYFFNVKWTWRDDKY